MLLMDEPCSALDPISTGKIEELILELKERFSIVIVTHNLGQATRISDHLAYFYVERDKQSRFGRLHEYGPTRELVENPSPSPWRAYLTERSVRVRLARNFVPCDQINSDRLIRKTSSRGLNGLVM